MRKTLHGFSDIVPAPERPGSKRPPDRRFAVRSGVNPPDRSPRSPPESPRLRIPCTVLERKWHGETTDGSVTPLESIAHALLPGVRRSCDPSPQAPSVA